MAQSLPEGEGKETVNQRLQLPTKNEDLTIIHSLEGTGITRLGSEKFKQDKPQLEIEHTSLSDTDWHRGSQQWKETTGTPHLRLQWNFSIIHACLKAHHDWLLAERVCTLVQTQLFREVIIGVTQEVITR